MCRVRAKILVARKLGREQKRRGAGLASIFARPESLLARSFARERLLRRLVIHLAVIISTIFLPV